MTPETLPTDLQTDSQGTRNHSDIDLQAETTPDTAPEQRLEYTSDSPETVTVTITNESSEHLSSGSLYIEAIPTAHVTPDISGKNLMPMGEPHTWEILQAVEPGEAITATLSITTDGLARPAWNGQIDLVVNWGMEVIDKKTVFIYG